jgi:hypothetical protein
MEPAGIEPATSCLQMRPAARSNAGILQELSMLVSPKPVTDCRSIPGGFGWIRAQISVLVASGRSRSDHGHAFS